MSWCLTNGFYWVFGIIISDDNDPIISYVSNVRRVEDAQDIEDILKLAVFYVCAVATVCFSLCIFSLLTYIYLDCNCPIGNSEIVPNRKSYLINAFDESLGK